MSPVRKAAACLAMALTLLGTGCSDRLAGGGGSEAGNAIVFGTVLDPEGRPVRSARIQALPAEYNPAVPDGADICKPAISDARGHYRILCSDTGRITLTGQVPDSSLRFQLAGLKPTLAAGGSMGTEAPVATPGLPGRIRVRLPEGIPPEGAYIYVPGTTLLAWVDTSAILAGMAVLDGVPPGTLKAVRFAQLSGAGPRDLAVDIDFKPDSTLDLGPYLEWKHARALRLNTTASGAGVDENVIDSPLLIRLDAGNFDFAQARSDGGDIRFSKPDGTPLPFEIESWNPAASQAAVWVALDTVYGARATQTLTMHWGRSGAVIPAGSRPVFDTAAGFAGVWHLQESAPGLGNAAVYRNSVPGSPAGDDSVFSPAGGGWIGPGLESAGREFVEVPEPGPGLQPGSALTLSAWVRPERLDSLGSTIATMGNSYGLRVDSDTTLWLFIWDGSAFLEFRSNPISLMDGQWHHVAGTFDGAQLRLFADGMPVGSLPATATVAYGLGKAFSIGNHGQGNTLYDDYVGGIDEVQVSRVARSAAWLKLSFENQRRPSKLVDFVP